MVFRNALIYNDWRMKNLGQKILSSFVISQNNFLRDKTLPKDYGQLIFFFLNDLIRSGRLK